jgi:hypothetical protein
MNFRSGLFWVFLFVLFSSVTADPKRRRNAVVVTNTNPTREQYAKARADYRKTVDLPARNSQFAVDSNGGGMNSYTGREIRKAVFNAHLNRAKPVGRGQYPHAFNNREGISMGKGLEYPVIKAKSGYQGVGSPGETRVTIGGVKKGGFKFKGVMAHPPNDYGTIGGRVGPPVPNLNGFYPVPQSS